MAVKCLLNQFFSKQNLLGSVMAPSPDAVQQLLHAIAAALPNKHIAPAMLRSSRGHCLASRMPAEPVSCRRPVPGSCADILRMATNKMMEQQRYIVTALACGGILITTTLSR